MGRHGNVEPNDRSNLKVGTVVRKAKEKDPNRPKSGDNNRKLTPEAQLFLLQQVAQFASHRQAAERLEKSGIKGFDDQPIHIDPSRVTRIVQDSRAEIEELRETYLSTFDEMPLAHTKMRVAQLTRLFQEASDGGLPRQDKNGNELPSRLKLGDAIELQARLLDSIRQEMNPIQHAFIVGASAEEARKFVATVGFGSNDPRALPRNPESDGSH